MRIILIHGMWHGAWCWFKTIEKLKKQGHEVIAVDLIGAGINSQSIIEANIENQVEHVANYLSDTQKSIVIAHSAGGVILSKLCEKFPHKIEKAIYLAAFMVANGKTLGEYTSKDYDSKVPRLIVDKQKGILGINPDCKEAFYNSTSDNLFELSKLLLRDINASIFGEIIKQNEEIPSYYICTKKDNAISYWLQKEMCSENNVKKVYTINSDHSPFFSANNKLVSIIKKIIKE